MTVDFGMNDGGYQVFSESGRSTYMRNLQGIADQAKAANIRVAWCTPSPVEKVELGPVREGYNQTLEKYSEGVERIAATNGGALFIDQLHPFMAVIDKARAADPKKRIGGGDPVHPGPPGHVIMASAILHGMSFPQSVAFVEIDGAAGKVISNSNCKIDGLVMDSTGKIEFVQLDNALPYFPKEAKSILQWAPVLEELNDYRLKVTGLKPGKYVIRLGGVKVAEYADSELRDGVNLAAAVLEAGPIADQVNSVWMRVKAKNDYFNHQIFRGVVLAEVKIPEFLNIKIDDIEAKRAAAFKERLAKMKDYYQAIRQALVMKPHQVEIIGVP